MKYNSWMQISLQPHCIQQESLGGGALCLVKSDPKHFTSVYIITNHPSVGHLSICLHSLSFNPGGYNKTKVGCSSNYWITSISWNLKKFMSLICYSVFHSDIIEIWLRLFSCCLYLSVINCSSMRKLLWPVIPRSQGYNAGIVCHNCIWGGHLLPVINPHGVRWLKYLKYFNLAVSFVFS